MPIIQKKSSEEKLSIIVINFNSTKYLNCLLKTINKIKKIVGEIIIVDNNSTDIKKLKTQQKITLKTNKKNLGFSKAVNQGVKISKYSYILLLNPDSTIIDDSINKIFEKIKNNKKIGAIGGQIINNGRKQYTATTKPTFLTGLFEFTNLKKLFPNNKFSKRFWIESREIKIKKEIEATSLCGTFILFRKIFRGQKNT